MKSIVQTTQAPAPIGPYSQAVWCGNLLFTSGQIAIDPETNALITHSIEEEATRVMENLKGLLEAAGVSFSNVIKSTIYLSDMNTFAQVNEVYGKYFSGQFPARDTVQVARLPKDVNVEISVIASK